MPEAGRATRGGLTSPGARIFVAGTATHAPGGVLPDVPSVAATARDLGRAFVERCGADPSQVRVLVDPADPYTLGSAAAAWAEQAEDVFVFYYIGHGLIGPGGELYLASCATNDPVRGLAISAMPYAAVRDALTECRARAVVAVLDCCFSGRARGSLGSASDMAFESAQVSGSFLLTSASGDEAALAPPGEPHTTFSGRLIRLLDEGDPAGPQDLTLDHVYRCLDRELPERGCPRPRRHAADRAGDFVLAPNPAHRRRAPVPRTRPAEAGSGDEGGLCPYPGLASFGVEDHRYYFGRDRLTRELLERLAHRMPASGPLLVVGPSGSGKSSLLRAGLIAAVTGGDLPVPGSRTWPCVLTTPGSRPLSELLARLGAPAPAPGADAGPVPDPGRLRDTARRLLRRHGSRPGDSDARLVLVVDQFEDVFAPGVHDAERTAFVRALTEASTGTDPPALVVIGLRADFYGRCTTFPELVPLLQDQHLVVAPMTPGELREAIEQPAHAAGLTLEEGLVDLLLRELRAQHMEDDGAGAPEGVLPLLSHALLATWQHREGSVLTVSGYQAAGGVWDAVARTAEATYAGLGEEERTSARAVLLRMVRVGESTDDVRRRIPLNDPAAGPVLDALARARLVTVTADSAEITHEALLRAWPRLYRWISDDRAGLLVGQQLAEAADAWLSEGRDSAALHRGARLEAARTWADDPRHEQVLTPAMTEFLAASTDRETAQRLAVRRRTRRLRALVAALSVLLVLAVTATALAVRASDRADRQRLVAVSRQVAAQSDALRADDPALAAQLALAAYRAAPTLEARSSLLSAPAHPYATRLDHPWAVGQVAFRPDGRVLATASADNAVRLWNTADPHHPVLLNRLSGYAAAVAFSPDGRLLATGLVDGSVALYDVSVPGRPTRVASLRGHQGIVSATVFSGTRPTLATGDSDGTVRLWDVSVPREPRLRIALPGRGGAVTALVLSPDGRLLATAHEKGQVMMRDITDPGRPVALPALTGHTRGVHTVAHHPRDPLLATGDGSGAVRLWNVSDPRRPRGAGMLNGHFGAVGTAVFSPDGATLATGGYDSTVRLWNTADTGGAGPLVTLPGHVGIVFSASFGADGRTLATGSQDNTARLWDLSAHILTGHTDFVVSLALRPDGRLLASGGGDRSVRLWDLSRSRRPTAVAVLEGHSDTVASADFSPDGLTLLTSSLDGSARLWDVRDPGHPRTLSVMSRRNTIMNAASFGPDGRTVAVATIGGGVHLWDVSDLRRPRHITVLSGHFLAVNATAFSPDGRLLVSAGYDGTVRLWDVGRPRQATAAAVLRGHTGFVYAAKFGPDGRTLATAGSDGTTRLWDLTRPRQARLAMTISEHAANALSVAFDSTGHTLAIGYSNRTVALWDISRAHAPTEAVAVVTGHSTSVPAIVFASDDRTLISAGDDHTVRVFGTDPEEVAQEICATVSPVISRAQWRRYLPDLPYRPPCTGSD
jgi:WD40 repeat protein/energy-coupling factor transporter ATP-binding protein EcfA2